MAIRNYDIGGMLARSGAVQGQQMGQAFSQFGRGIEGMLSGVGVGLEARRKRQEEEDLKKQMASIYAPVTQSGATSADLFTAANQLIQAGQVKEASALLESANEKLEGEKQTAEVKRLQTSLSERAKNLKLTGMAETINETTDLTVLKDIAKDIRAQELKGIPVKSEPIRRRIAKASGINKEEFDKLDLSKVSDEEFDAIITGEKGKVESWMTKDGKIKTYRVNDAGLVYNEETGMWQNPGEIGITRAPPQVQQIEEIASEMGKELAKVGAKNFEELKENADAAVSTIRSIDESFPLIDDMFTGSLADLKLNINKYAKAFGINLGEFEGVENTETYVAMAATRLAKEIKALGSGTGLSDTDRTYTEAIVGGKIAADSAALKNILVYLRQGAVNKINKYNQVREDIRGELGENQKGVLAFFPSVQLPQAGTKTVDWGDM
jgi:hypothetical protein